MGLPWGVPYEAVEILGELNLHWKGGHLLVAWSASGRAKLMEDISGCFLDLMRFKPFTDSRWMTMGDSCSTLICSCLLGFRSLAESVRRDPKCGDYYTSGFACINDTTLWYGMICSVVSNISDPVLQQLLKDDRAPKTLDLLEGIVKEKIEWLE